MRKSLIVSAAAAIILSANLLIAEALAGLYLFYKTGSLVWLRETVATNVSTLPSETGPSAIGGVGLTLSPYFGYVNASPSGNEGGDDAVPLGIGETHDPAEPFDCDTAPNKADCQFNLDTLGITWKSVLVPQWRVNNHGILSPYDYPVRDLPQEAFVIGVFGGSVAFNYSYWAFDRHSPILKGLQATLGRPVILLPFAIGGGKQPQQAQQLMLFSALGQRFDLVLNIDGFNEAYVSWLNIEQSDVEYVEPAAKLVSSITKLYQSRVSNDAVQARQRSLDKWSKMAGSTRSAIVSLVARIMADRNRNKIRRLEESWAANIKVSEFPIHRVKAKSEFDQAVPEIVDLWAQASVNMAALARIIGADYLHVLQPSQYFSNKTFTDQEINKFDVLGEGDAPLRAIVPQVYKAMLTRVPRLRKRGAAIVTPVRLFDRVDGTVFYDYCCHFNHFGNELLDLVIQHRILSGLDKDKFAARLREIEARLMVTANTTLAAATEPGEMPTRDYNAADSSRLTYILRVVELAERYLQEGVTRLALAEAQRATALLNTDNARNPGNPETLQGLRRAYRVEARAHEHLGNTAGYKTAIYSRNAVLDQLMRAAGAADDVAAEMKEVRGAIQRLPPESEHGTD